MKRLIVVAAALALAACGLTPAPQPTPTAPTTAGTVVLTGERAFAVAELAYITAARGVEIAVDHGAIRGATATRVREWNAKATAALKRGKATADAATKAAAAAELLGIAKALDAITGRK